VIDSTYRDAHAFSRVANGKAALKSLQSRFR